MKASLPSQPVLFMLLCVVRELLNVRQHCCVQRHGGVGTVHFSRSILSVNENGCWNSGVEAYLLLLAGQSTVLLRENFY